jgi:mono/diheme cytochrome c family protein
MARNPGCEAAAEAAKARKPAGKPESRSAGGHRARHADTSAWRYDVAMKKSYRSHNIFLGAMIGLTLLTVGGSMGMSKNPRELAANATSDGRELFRQYCAVCHGVDARGGGPSARALKRPPSDLTLLSRMNGGKFPALSVQLTIQGSTNAVIEHGSRDMPIWGPVLNNQGENLSLGDKRLHALVAYLEQIQAK